MPRGLPILFYALLVGGFIACLIAFPSADSSLPMHGERPSVDLSSLAGFKVEAFGGLPAWSAKRARPTRPGAVVTLGGTYDGLELDGVAVEFGGLEANGLVSLTADRGRYADASLTLSGAVRVDSRVVSGEVVIAAGQIRFPGLVVFHHGSAEAVTERVISFTYADFVARVQRR